MAPDLFPGYASQHFKVDTPGSPSIFGRFKLENLKPPLLLLHGFPQTHVEFHKVAPLLEPYFSLVLLDLRGYGLSSTVSSENGSGYSKRLMAQDAVTVMQRLGYDHFSILGHDRGARVAYRLALDTPGKVDKVIVVDIIPTHSMFGGFGDIARGLRGYHWLFLAQPAPFPETLIKAADNGKFFLENTLASWTAKRTLEDFDLAALEVYREAYCSDERIHSTCEDYRAGAHLDRAFNEEDVRNGNKIHVPLLAVWGQRGLFAEAMKSSPLDIWIQFAEDVTGVGLECGHFITEEDPEGFVNECLKFLGC
jgi:haloacetate dehalogenase